MNQENETEQAGKETSTDKIRYEETVRFDQINYIKI